MIIRLAALAILPAALLFGADAKDEPKFAPEQVQFYEKEVKPLLEQHCLKCHGAEPKIKGELNLTTRGSVLAGGEGGAVYDPKKPENSRLLKGLDYSDPDFRMPPKGKLSDKDIATLAKWVKEGMPFPAGKLGVAQAHPKPKGGVVTEEAKKYWAYQPVKRPPVPAIKSANPIDAFIAAKLAEKKLEPAKPADRVQLVRRAYYDLWGLPPTPEQVDAFVKDESLDAWPKLIDSLLASPHYGEKWGRHWLDVVRFAETNGYERDGWKPNAWRYRDYVIRSFNDDKPFDQFAKEQIAGDEMPGENRDAIIATGFYRLGLWDDEPADPAMALYEGYDDLVTVAGQGFLGMTMNCARCHDHKVDPIPQADYYKLVAFFRDIRPFQDVRGLSNSTNSTDITPPERRKLYEDAERERQKKLGELNKKIVAIENEVIKTMSAEDQRKAEGPERPEVAGKVIRLLMGEKRIEYSMLKRDRDNLEKKSKPEGQEFALSVNFCDPRPPAVFVLPRGNAHAKGAEVKPGFPEVLGVPEPKIPESKGKTSGRRTVLANWIASKENPLTSRVIVNRVWQGHFGRGIVPTPNDFGGLGEKPTHPELLDWLAAEFTEPTKPTDGRPWAFKRLHKLIMMSDTYQRSSIASEQNLKADPNNMLFWRFNMRRLNSEEIRDSILTASGLLNDKMFGPPVFPKLSKEVLDGISYPDKNAHWPTSKAEESTRRTVYVCVKRSLQVPILAIHDQADTDNSCPVRYTTTVPTQALGLLNGEFANESAAAFAARLMKEEPNGIAKQVARGIRLTTGRTPAESEIAKDTAFIQLLKDRHKLDEKTALTRYCLLLLNSNEFAYLD